MIFLSERRHHFLRQVHAMRGDNFTEWKYQSRLARSQPHLPSCPMSFPIAGRCEFVPFGSSKLLGYQQASGLDFIDVQMQKIRYILAFRENPTQFRHEQKCCGMTNFDGIRCQEWPSSIIFSFRKVFTAGMIPGNGSE